MKCFCHFFHQKKQLVEYLALRYAGHSSNRCDSKWRGEACEDDWSSQHPHPASVRPNLPAGEAPFRHPFLILHILFFVLQNHSSEVMNNANPLRLSPRKLLSTVDKSAGRGSSGQTYLVTYVLLWNIGTHFPGLTYQVNLNWTGNQLEFCFLWITEFFLTLHVYISKKNARSGSVRCTFFSDQFICVNDRQKFPKRNDEYTYGIRRATYVRTTF